MDTPFPWLKQLASHYGATRNGVVIDWPGHIAAPGGTRTQFHHVIDIMPTLLEAAHVPVPESVDGVRQQPLDGVSMAYSFNAPAAPSTRHSQYYQIWDNMALYKDGWVAASTPEVYPWNLGPEMTKPAHIEGRKWELFNVARDFSESTDLAARYPAKLAELKQAYFAEAAKYNGTPVHRSEGRAGHPDYNAGVTHFHFGGPVDRIQPDAAPRMVGSSFDIDADVELGAGSIGGSILALGGRFGGFALFLRDGRPTFEYNFANLERTTVASQVPLAPGRHRIGVAFRLKPSGDDAGARGLPPAEVTLTIDGKPAGVGTIPRTASYRVTLDESFDVGSDRGTPVSESYASPNVFPGTIHAVDVDIRE